MTVPDTTDTKQATRSQYIGVFMVIFGAASVGVGCRFHWAELTTASSGIIGAGINMLTNQIASRMRSATTGSGDITMDNPTTTA